MHGALISKYDVRANRRRRGTSFDGGFNEMHYTSRERERRGTSTGFLENVNFGFVRLCRWMHFWNGGHLRSAPRSRQGTKKRRENWEKEYVSGGSSSSLHTTGGGKKGSPVTTFGLLG